MTTSGTTSFSLPLDELLEEAFARIGGEPTPAQDWRTALRTLNLLFTDMQNRGILLFTLEEKTQALTASDKDYTLDTDTLDILTCVYRNTTTSPNIDLVMERTSYEEWMTIAKKDSTASRPSSWNLDRQQAAPILRIYPAPSAAAASGGELHYWRVRFIQDAGSLSNTPDVPRRFQPAVVSGMAYFLALKRPGIKWEDKQGLKAEYMEDLQLALEEDRDRASAYVKPYRRPL